MDSVRVGTTQGRWVIGAAVLGSGVAFLDGSVVNAALPAIAHDLHSSLSGLQWVLTGYLLTLGSLLVLGGSLGDLFGRRRLFVLGLGGFTAASVMCGLAPDLGVLIAARVAQGVAAAALVPGSLAMISATFAPDDRGAAIGAWSGLGGVAAAVGPFLGGWLIDSVSWRWIFFINVPLSAAAIAIALRHVPETRDEHASGHVDIRGALALSMGLAGLVYALIEGPSAGWPRAAVLVGALGVAALVVFAVVERSQREPMVPLTMFRSRQFTGANAVTFVVYAALGAVGFLLTVHLQTDLRYSALEAGAATLPISAMMLALSARSGALAQRIGPRIPMTVGPAVIASAFALYSRVKPGVGYVGGVLPAVLVLGAGLVLTVSPLTAAVLAAVDQHRVGVGSAVNNAVARVASLLAIAVLPAAAGISTRAGRTLNAGFGRAMVICAALSVAGAVVAWLSIRARAAQPALVRAVVTEPCIDCA